MRPTIGYHIPRRERKRPRSSLCFLSRFALLLFASIDVYSSRTCDILVTGEEAAEVGTAWSKKALPNRTNSRIPISHLNDRICWGLVKTKRYAWVMRSEKETVFLRIMHVAWRHDGHTSRWNSWMMMMVMMRRWMNQMTWRLLNLRCWLRTGWQWTLPNSSSTWRVNKAWLVSTWIHFWSAAQRPSLCKHIVQEKENEPISKFSQEDGKGLVDLMFACLCLAKIVNRYHSRAENESK